MTNFDEGMDSAKSEYTVGYGKPPIEHQFPKGKSGNPNGRPRHPATFEACLNRQLSKKMKITENGHVRKETMLTIASKQLVNAIAKGDIEYMKLFAKYYAQIINIEKELYREPSIEVEEDPIAKEKRDKLTKYLREFLDYKHGFHKDYPPE